MAFEWTDKQYGEKILPEHINSLAKGIKENEKAIGSIPKPPTKTSELINDSGFLKEIPDEYVTEEELKEKGYLTKIPDQYVTEDELIPTIQLFTGRLVTNNVYRNNPETDGNGISVPVPVNLDSVGTQIELDTTIQNQVLMYLKMTAVEAVTWAEGLKFVNDEIPTIGIGCYRVIFEYNPNLSAWVVGVIQDGAVE